MDMGNSQAYFQRGVITLIVLALLKREDMYGYQLVQEISRLSGGKLFCQEGTLYPVLYKLQDQGFISARKELVGKRMTRVYYHLEPAGLIRMTTLTREYEDVTKSVLQIVYGEGKTNDNG